MPPHPQIRRFRELLALWGQLTGDDPSIEDLRRARRRVPAAAHTPHPPPAEVRDLEVDGPGGPVPVRLYRPRPRSAGPLPALVYLHGGGFVLGDIDDVDGLCRELSARVGCAVVNVGYRLAPEHPFPAAVEDAWAALADVAARPGRYGADPARLAVAGESAGGNLAAVTAQRARDEGLALVHQLLVYPVTDTAMDTPSWAEHGSGLGLDAAMMAAYLDLYRCGADPADPRLAPLRAADLSGLAPATVITAEYDILRDEGEAYARRLAEAGVPVELRRYPGMIHSFFLLPEIFEDGARARALAAARLRAAFAAGRSAEPAP
ncbi:alpha/beta hydrolase [Thermomonospora amylolytica]|uniref:alpha/beta hydrolase n=1 Tax=Thermomonospora amylolytica TaxID=1411117 RepID=UPI000E6B84E3|nr:alpha/beta hydrolase [Thermomonospora amylolytica]